MCWKPRWWRWFVFFSEQTWKRVPSLRKSTFDANFSTFSIYVMAVLLTVAHKRHYQDMVSHKRLYHTSIKKLSPKICFAVVVGQNIMRSQEGNLVEMECNWWQNIFCGKPLQFTIFVLAAVAFVAIIDVLRFKVDPWVWHLVWWLVSSLFIIFTSQKDEVEPHLKNTAQFVALTVIIIRNIFKRDG